MNKKQIVSAIEAVLFASGDPISIDRISQTFEIKPEEVETYLQRNDYIAECMVYADVDNLGNETVVSAHIFPDFNAVEGVLGKEYSEEDLRAFIDKQIKEVNAKMAPNKRVMRFDIRHEEFVKTTTKKIKRFAN